MNLFIKSCLIGTTALTLCSSISVAENHDHSHHNHHETLAHNHSKAPSAPLHIMGDHTHAKGDWMFSYRASRMHMDGNRHGTSSISATDIVTGLTNPNAPPANVRVVPTKMNMDMHMFGTMYGATNKLTLMAMAMYMDNEMQHITFSGMMGTNQLGRFTTKSRGWGDLKFGGIYNIHNDKNHNINIGLTISAPTGSIKEEDDVLTPMNTRMRMRLPYAMQLGSGTWDTLPSITYTGQHNKWSWGSQLRSTFRLESRNSQGYRRGNQTDLSLWGGYKFSDSFALTANIDARHLGKIKGKDTSITAPVQTANPDNYGGKTIETGLGFSYKPSALKGIEFSAQISAPIYQNLNGVQMEKDWNMTSGLIYRF